MKHFFYCREENSQGLLKDVLSKLGKTTLDNLKVLYDATDIIYDKRLPDSDQELSECFEEYKSIFSCDVQPLKYKALFSLWQYAEAQANNLDSHIAWTLFHLVRGNICLRLSEYFYDQYKFQQSELWGDRAIEILWHGLQNQEDNDEINDNKENMDVLLCLMHFNLAMYYMDYSRRNHRSNYTSAELAFKALIDKIENNQRAEENSVISRQYALIYVQANCNLISISRRKYHISKAYEDSKNLNDQLNDPTGLLSNLNRYDIERYRILAKLDFARINRDKHSPDFYDKAINLAKEANNLSLELDKTTNIDAVIILSSAFRKSLKFSTERECLVEQLKSLSFKNLDENTCDLFAELVYLADRGHINSKAELIKWYYTSVHLKKQDVSISLPEEKITNYLLEEADSSDNSDNSDKSDNPEKSDKSNIQIRFLKGIVLLCSNQYTKAKKLFLELLQKEETNYIRLGTIGLKVRYLLANACMSLGQFSEAKHILQRLYNTLKDVREGRLAQENGQNQQEHKERRNSNVCSSDDAWRQEGQECKEYQDNEMYAVNEETDSDFDLRTIIDLIYCFMRQGNYDKAYDIYLEYYKNISHKKNPEVIEIDDNFLHRVKKARRIAGLNNLISCCIFSFNPEEKETTKNRLQTAINAFKYLEEHYGREENNPDYQRDFEENPEINLLYGYFILLTGQKPTGSIGNSFNLPETITSLKEAHSYFERACGYKHGFSSVYDLETNGKERDRAYFSNRVCYVSAYLISLVRSYYHSKDYAKYIERFILGIPKKYEISMNAAIALAEWLLNYKTDEENKRQLFRSFGFVTIYEERGARAFNQLRYNSAFRLFATEQRGEIIARLLNMYRPIKKLKEDCTYSLVDKAKYKQFLVHYTSQKSLRVLLQKNARFRLSNCGYMNDVFEGREFLNCMEKVVYVQSVPYDNNTNCNKENKSTNKKKKKFQELLDKYFPHLERPENDMQPSGSHVYIVSLSVKEDSFPLWKIYSENEAGCSIEFDEDFFDVNGAAYRNSTLRDYLPPRYTDKDYPLYIVQYIGSDFPNTDEVNDKHKQTCKTESINYRVLSETLTQLFERWCQLDEYLKFLFKNANSTNKESIENRIENSIQTIRQFAAERLNEVRFLFKSSDYEFEGEVRVVHTTEQQAEISYDGNVPRAYIDIDKEIEGLTIRLGSKIEDTTVDQLVTWLKSTGCVKKVKLAKRNRYTSRLRKETEILDPTDDGDDKDNASDMTELLETFETPKSYGMASSEEQKKL